MRAAPSFRPPAAWRGFRRCVRGCAAWRFTPGRGPPTTRSLRTPWTYNSELGGIVRTENVLVRIVITGRGSERPLGFAFAVADAEGFGWAGMSSLREGRMDE